MDSVKSFHSSLILSDILKERDYQKQIIKQKLEHDKEVEKHWEDVEVEKMKAFDERELRKAEEVKLKKLEQMSSVNKQFREFKLKKVREYMDGVVEGNIIQSNAKQAIQDEKDKEKAIRHRAVQQKEDFKRENEALEKLKEKKKMEEDEQLRIIQMYAQKKQDIADLKIRKENEKFLEKQRKRQVMIDQQIMYLKGLQNKEEEILEKQKQESDKKFNDELTEKKRRFDEFKVSLFYLSLLFLH